MSGRKGMLHKEYPVKTMCEFFGVSRAAYYAWIKYLEQPDLDAGRKQLNSHPQTRTYTKLYKDYDDDKRLGFANLVELKIKIRT